MSRRHAWRLIQQYVQRAGVAVVGGDDQLRPATGLDFRNGAAVHQLRAERQLCWFHVMQWVTRKLAEVLKRSGETLPDDDRKLLARVRFRLLACPETLERHRAAGRLSERTEQALGRAWQALRGTAFEDAVHLRDDLRDDLRAILNQSATRREAHTRFDALRQTWPARFHPRRGWLDGWRPGQPLPPKPPLPAPPAAAMDDDLGDLGDLERFLDEIRAFFMRHFEQLVTYLDYPGVPRTNNHAERANRRYRAVSRPRYGWQTTTGHRAMLVALQGFDTS